MSQELSRALRFLPSLVSAPERLHKYTAKPIEEKHPLSKDTFSQSEKRKQILPKFNMEPKNDGLSKRKTLLFQSGIFRFHVKLWEGMFTSF